MQAPDNKQVELERLNDENKALKARLRELEQHRILTSAEEVERSQLRQMRHQTEERILQLQEN